MSGITINEIHYDNAGGDSGEFVELKIPADTMLDEITITLYNGSDAEPYSTTGVGSGMAEDSGDGFAYIAVPVNGIQNGSPDGVAVDLNGVVCEFISYEGTITAEAGPAAGMTSTDIGVSESGTTAIGESLQVVDGAWAGPMPATPNATNCFLEGTRIATRSGLVPIEDLHIGDEIAIYPNGLSKIKWIGKQMVDPSQINDVRYGHPIHIGKDALQNNMPSSDLFVSPGHGIYVEGLLINAGALVNDSTIRISLRQELFNYYHIELDRHELVIAEGVPVESFLPYKADRDNYDNGAEYHRLYPDDANVLPWPMDYPRITAATQVPEEIWEAISGHAESEMLKSA